MKAKHQRLVLAIVAVVALTGSSLLAMSALKDQASYFYAPGDIARKGVPPGAIRLGGMIPMGGITHASDGVTIDFTVRDETGSVPVRFRGIVPALFKEGSGVVAEGSFVGKTFVATNLLAKHDENYMPPKAAGAEHVTKTLKE
ncbi:cytochrome c maturation protein CcmE [Sphingomonas sp.]|uniref:cytochrome c maturation protein CcmE n=1 Tax=Sphingomonas sp. TaxID=28214 RepID=UPI0025F1A52A|nr:cytochrome c maturation protein CcmE [Sphingomonas sp.]